MNKIEKLAGQYDTYKLAYIKIIKRKNAMFID